MMHAAPTRSYPTALSLLIGTLILLLSVTSPMAEENEEEGSDYLAMTPPFVVNLEQTGRGLNYLRADITLRLTSPGHAESVEHHMPWLRHDVVSLLSNQPVDRAQSGEGQDELRQEVLERLNKRLEEEKGEAMIRDVLFTTFVVQRR